VITAVHRRTASAWHDGDWSPLYAYASTGAVLRGLDREIRECLDVVERGELDLELDPVVEHERLLALLRAVEPEIARAKAREIGVEDGETAAAWWQQDVLGGRATGDTSAVARQVLAGIEDGDPAILDALTTSIEGYTAEDLQADCDWEEPDVDDRPAHGRWEATRPELWDAYQTACQESFHDAVAAACQREVGETRTPTSLQEPTMSVPIRRPQVAEKHLARACYQGADVAAIAASGFLLTPSEARAVLAERHHIHPPALTHEWGAHPAPQGLANEILGRRLNDARAGDAEAVTAIAQAWEVGRAIVWDAALRANAFRTLGRPREARPFEQLYEGRVRMLAEAARPTAETRRAGPYIRAGSPGEVDADTASRAAPPGWVVEPIGMWEGVPHEVVYDPRRHEVAVTESAHDVGPTASPGWDLRATDGSRGFWTLDRVAEARASLDRFEQLAMGIEVGQPSTNLTRSEPARELGL
jgi:hypothetical protein